VLGYEAAGVVDALGPGVDSPAIGTPVVALCRFWAQADVICVGREQVGTMPKGVTFEKAAALPVKKLTPYHALFRVAALRNDDHVLIHMAAGGVGMATLQLCATVKGVITYGTASANKHDVLRQAGCHHPIDYHNADYAKKIRALTQGRG